MDLDKLATLATIVGNFFVAGGLLFAAVQLKDYRRERADSAAIELARIWHEPNFGRHMRLILELPAGTSGEELRERGAEHTDAALVIAMSIETIGLMVHQRILRLEIVWELMGGMTLASWDRLEAWIHLSRAEQGNEKFAEWLEWLVTQLKAKESQNHSPAHIRNYDWKQ